MTQTVQLLKAIDEWIGCCLLGEISDILLKKLFFSFLSLVPLSWLLLAMHNQFPAMAWNYFYSFDFSYDFVSVEEIWKKIWGWSAFEKN